MVSQMKAIMNFADGFGWGRVCLVLGIVLMVWGACREPMMPTRPAVVVPLRVPAPAADDEDEVEGELPVLVKHEEEKAGR